MKRIIVVRHAKAVPYGYDDDFNRTLTERGFKDARKVATRLLSLNVRPGLMIASPATRTLQTAEVFSDVLSYPVTGIRQEPGLYMDFSTGEFVDFVRALDNLIETICVFGHNPGISYYASRLAADFHGDMPTCSTVGIDFMVDSWNKIESRTGKTVFHLFPKMLS